jgi:Guanosine polyphosphate pyrophosphohydrolases/synthetases
MRKYGFRDWESVLAAIGHGGLKEGQIVNKLVEEYKKKNKKEITDENVLESISREKVPAKKSKSGIVVEGIHDVAVRFSKCCSPVPGDEIVGFVTRGRGVSIHRTDCINIINIPDEDRVRLIDAEWNVVDGKSLDGVYSAEIKIYANNRTGVLVDVSKVLTENKIDVTSMNVRTSKQGTATISIGFEINGKDHLNEIIAKIRNVESVLDIERTAG